MNNCKNCPVNDGYKPAEAVHQIAEPAASVEKQIEEVMRKVEFLRGAAQFGSPCELDAARKGVEEKLRTLLSTPQPCSRSHPHEEMTPMCELRTEIARLTNALARAEAQLAAAPQAVQQGVQPSPEATSIAPTLMTNDQAIAWAWADVRKDVGTENWTTGDSCNFYGFFLYGWNYRGQYELQRNATKAAVMREIADTCDYELQQAPAHPAEGVSAQAFKTKVYQALGIGSACDEHVAFTNIENLIRREHCLSAIEREFFMVETPPDEGEGDTGPGEECLLNWGSTPEQYIKQFAEAIAATHPTQQGMDDLHKQMLKALESVGAHTVTDCDGDEITAYFCNWQAISDAKRAAQAKQGQKP